MILGTWSRLSTPSEARQAFQIRSLADIGCKTTKDSGLGKKVWWLFKLLESSWKVEGPSQMKWKAGQVLNEGRGMRSA